MRESIKVVSVVVFSLAAVGAAIAWFDDRPTSTTLALRYACPVLAILAIGFFLRMHFRADDAPDYLREELGNYFNRDGFCFGVVAAALDGVCYFDVYFQNQFANRCVACVALRPAQGFFLNRAEIDYIGVQLTCEPAAFGVARVAVPLPSHVQGRRQRFEVGASVSYPEGKGRRVRFADGVLLRANSNFGNAVGAALAASAFVTGTIVLVRPATITIELPSSVAETAVRPLGTNVFTYWKLGDPLLEHR